MGGILSIYFAVRGRHNKVFPCDWRVGVSEKREREREEVMEVERERMREGEAGDAI